MIQSIGTLETGLALAAMAALAALMWLRRLRRIEQRHAAGAFYKLSEEVIAATSPTQIAEKFASGVPGVPHVTSAQLYLFNRGSKCLERVPTSQHSEPMVAPIHDPPDGLASVAVRAFRERARIAIPDVRRNPMVKLSSVVGVPRAAIFVPLISHQEPLGVLEIDNATKVGYLPPEDQAAVQHLANQVAASLKLQEQHTMREQLFRGEKMAATGQLISGVASELQGPLESISQLSATLAKYAGHLAPAEDLRKLTREALRASEIVGRLVSFANQENAAPATVEIGSLLSSLMGFRQPEWEAQGLRVQNHVGADPCLVLGVEGQLEQVFLTLLVHAEQQAAQSKAKIVSIKTGVLGDRVLVTIDYSPSPTAAEEPDPFLELSSVEAGALGLGVCKGIIGNHGGEIRQHRSQETFGFEVDLPAFREVPDPILSAEERGSTPELTLLLVDTDPVASHHLMTLLGSRGHRVVPATAETAVDLVERLPFNAVLWAVRSGRGGWGEFHDRVRARVPAFVLVSNGYDQELANSLEQSGGFLLARPVQEAVLDRILNQIGSRVGQT